MTGSPKAGFTTPEETSVMALDHPLPLAIRACGTARWRGRVLAGAGLALLPWLGYLAGTLPPAEAAAWVALDALEAAALITAGSRLLHADPRHRVPAAAMAVCAELPLAALCAALAVRPVTRRAEEAPLPLRVRTVAPAARLDLFPPFMTARPKDRHAGRPREEPACPPLRLPGGSQASCGT
ncbi:hypothetical protein [Streptomyces sp. NPDC048242]|uniref:hypothetical protein n=1 Tax=Streptomyces sp. NPDC048242 TaxID=3155026 RepID=UPI00343E8F0F